MPMTGIPTFLFGHPREMTSEEIAAIPGKFAAAAVECEAAGFGGVQVCMCSNVCLVYFRAWFV